MTQAAKDALLAALTAALGPATAAGDSTILAALNAILVKAQAIVISGGLSPDGASAPPLTEIVDAEGRWTFGGDPNQRDVPVLLNGQPSAGSGHRLVKVGGVRMFGGGSWYARAGGKWVRSTEPGAPSSGPPPVGTTPPPATPPSTPPATPPAQVAGLAVSLGNQYRSQRYNWMADYIDLTKLPAPVPFNCYADKANGILAPSQNGVKPERHLMLPVLGNGGGLYCTTPLARADGTIKQWTGYAGDAQQITDDMYSKLDPKRRLGVRGVAVVDAYVTWHGHLTVSDAAPNIGKPIPRAPFALGAALDGTILALYHNPASVLELGKVKGVTSCFDFAFHAPMKAEPDPTKRLNRKILFVADRDVIKGTGRVIMIDRARAIAERKSRMPAGVDSRTFLGEAGLHEDSTLWDQTDFITGMGCVTSLRSMDDGTLYVCDNTNKRIIRATIDGAGPVPVLVKTETLLQFGPALPAPFFIDYTSDQRLVILDQASGVYVVDPANPVLGENFTTPADRSHVIFGTIDVDRHGTFGPVDTMAFSRSHGVGNYDCFFYTKTPTGWTCKNLDDVRGGESNAPVGPTRFSAQPFGHYPWFAMFHPDQGVMMAGGMSNTCPLFVSVVRPNDPPEGEWWHNLFMRGKAVFLSGSIAGHEGTKPSFTCQLGIDGFGTLVCADHVMERSRLDGTFDIQGAADYIRSGMIGSFRRDEIQGADMMALLYFFAGCSQRRIREGQKLLDQIIAAFLGTWPATTEPPVLFDDNSAIRATAVVQDGKIKVRFRDIDNNDKTPDPAVVVSVFVDEGTAAEKAAGAATGPLWELPAPAVSVGQHGLSCRVSGATRHRGEATIWIKA